MTARFRLRVTDHPRALATSLSPRELLIQICVPALVHLDAEKLDGYRRKPRHLRSDNGGEFIAGVLQRWLNERGIVARFVEPGSPWQNGVNESFNGRFRDECLNSELLESALEAQVIARAYREEYNDIRPHSSIDYRAPSAVRAELLKQAPGLLQPTPPNL